MNWQEKLDIIMAIANCSLRMRKPDYWYVDAKGMYTADGAVLYGEYGNGKTPEEAVVNHYALYVTELPATRLVKIDTGSINKYYKFEKYMWREYTSDEAAAYFDINRRQNVKKN